MGGVIGCVCFRSDLDSGDGVSEEEAEEGHYSQYDELGRTPPRTQLSRYDFVLQVGTRYVFVVLPFPGSVCSLRYCVVPGR